MRLVFSSILSILVKVGGLQSKKFRNENMQNKTSNSSTLNQPINVKGKFIECAKQIYVH